MKIVLNRCFGSFHYPRTFCERYHLDAYDWLDYEVNNDYRFHEMLIWWVENHPNETEGLEVVEIPDNVTDWQIHEYDGAESIICVIDGKIVWL